MFNNNILKFSYGKNIIKLENGYIARQCTSSIIASMNDTVVVVTLVYNDEIKNDQNFLPLTVHYQEKFYSIGKIPGSFFRREGRPSDVEIIISRLIDRSIRPLFNDKFLYNIQIVINVISVNPQISTDIISIIAVSAVLKISGINDIESLGVARVGYINNKYILNPTLNEIIISKLNLIVVGTNDAIFMIDCSSKNINENYIFNGINFAYDNYKCLINNINKFSLICKKSNLINNINNNIINNKFFSDNLDNYIYDYCIKKIKSIYLQKYNKKERIKLLNDIKNNLLIELLNNNENFYEYLVLNKINKIEKEVFIENLIKYGIRIDGRKENDIRNIDIKIGFLPKRVHGSSLFTRGETQALVTITLGTLKDAQSFDDILLGERLDNFIFHYNFPPYSVGEIGNIGIPKRREIGHGYLAKKGIIPILPNIKKFPYTIRIVSDIMESNGSSSMASVCGASLALMDAGVPIKCHVAGISMGLIKTSKKNFIISDIIGDEDRLGDMDFKVVGTNTGITALQMDMKTKGIDLNNIHESLKKANVSRLYILNKMNYKIKFSRSYLSPYCPKIYKFKVDVNKIKDIIGKGGSVIKYLTQKNNCLIEVNNDGLINIVSNNKINAINTIKDIKEIIGYNIKKNCVYLSKIIKIVNFGLFVSIYKGKENLIHISKITYKNKKIDNIFNYFKIGQYIYVRVIDIDINGKLKLSIENNIKINKNKLK